MVKVKFRYFLLEVIGNDFGDKNEFELSFSCNDVFFALTGKVADLYGDYGYASLQMGFSVKRVNPSTRIVYVKARRGPHRLLASAIPFVNTIKRKPCCIRTLHTSGTVRSCNKFLRKHGHEQLIQLLKICSSDDQRRAVQKSIKNCLKKVKDVLED